MSTTMTDLASGKTFVFDTALPGRDAYEEALAQGFEGTRADWLASLKGFDFDPDAPDWESDRWYHPPAAVLHDHRLWVARAPSIAEPPEDSSAVWKLALDGASAADLVQAVVDANQHREDADTARADAETALSQTQTVLAQTQATAAALAPIEALHPLDQPVPKGWWDTGDRLELAAPMISRALISNWHPGLIHPDVIGFQVENHTFTDLEATTLAQPGQPVATATNWADQIVTLQPENNSRPTFGRYPASGIRNLIPNNTTEGAVLGVLGAGGSLPDRWEHSFSGGAAGSIEVVSIASDYIDVEIIQTGNSGAPIIRPMTTGASIPVALGETWTSSFYIALIEGSFDGNGSVQLRGTQRDEAANSLNSMNFLSPVPVTNTLTRFSGAGEVDNPLASRMNSDLRIQSSGPWTATLRIGLPQLERGAVATPVQITNTDGYDITEAGQRSIYYLRLDDVDDWMQLVNPFAPEGAYTLAASVTTPAGTGAVFGRAAGQARFGFTSMQTPTVRYGSENTRSWLISQAGRQTLIFTASGAATYNMRRNGLDLNENVATASGNLFPAPNSFDAIGRDGGTYGAFLFSGGAMIPQAVSEGDRIRLQRYLSSLSGVSL